jgi:adenylate cyclase
MRLSLAILPFANLAGDDANDFFSDGITEELIGSISRLPRLRVVSRTSAFSFRNQDVSLPEIGAQLRVGYVLTGSVRRAGDRLRLAAQLSRVADDTLLWSETYERKVADVFDVQDDLSRRITATVREALGTSGATTPARVRHAHRVTAYDQYLLGRYTWNKRTPESLREGLACFQRAIDPDPEYAPGYVGLADSHAIMASSGVAQPQAAYPVARAAASRAIELVKIHPMSSCSSYQWYVSPGNFSVKKTASQSSTSFTVTGLPNTDCYGIHVDVERLDD